MKKIKILSIFLMLIIAFAGCKKDDFTGHSTQVPTNPTITVDLGTIPTVIDGVTQKHKITLNMDVAQIVDVAVHITVLDGTATQDEDYSVPNVVTIAAGRTSASFEVTFIPDENYEPTETFKIQIGDERTANASINPVTQNYSIINYTENDLKVGLSWAAATDVYDVNGNLYDDDVLADMILTVYDVTGDSVLIEADGGTFEELILADSIADGEYRVLASFFGVEDLGDQGSVDLNLSVNAYQIGIQDATLSFDEALNTVANIDNTIYLTVIDKIGSTWTMTEFGGFTADELDFASATWNDGLGDGWMPDFMYPNQVVIAGTTGSYTIDGLSFGWMVDFWGETITTSTPVNITFSDDGSLEILFQYTMTTDYGGNPYDYDIYSESGSWNRYMTPIALTIIYQLDQDGFIPAEYYGGTAYNENDYFIADIIQTGVKKRSINKPKKVNVNKPY